jgi:hypothetical protein
MCSLEKVDWWLCGRDRHFRLLSPCGDDGPKLVSAARASLKAPAYKKHNRRADLTQLGGLEVLRGVLSSGVAGRRGPVALRPRLSPGVPSSVCKRPQRRPGDRSGQEQQRLRISDWKRNGSEEPWCCAWHRLDFIELPQSRPALDRLGKLRHLCEQTTAKSSIQASKLQHRVTRTREKVSKLLEIGCVPRPLWIRRVLVRAQEGQLESAGALTLVSNPADFRFVCCGSCANA